MNAPIAPPRPAVSPAALAELNPPQRLLMGPGPINADPRVLRAMAAPLLGQFDPQFRAYMRETQELFRAVFETRNVQTLMIDGTARSAIEAVMASLVVPGDRVLVASFGRFGQLKSEIARRCGAVVTVVQREWGTVFTPKEIEDAIIRVKPKLLALCQGDTSTTMLQPLDEVGRIARRHGVMVQVDATASLAGAPLPVDAWQIDCVTAGLQKCLAGPSGIAPVTLSDALADAIYRRRHVEEGLRPADYVAGSGPIINSNYFDLAMVMDYWSDKALNHHTEATTMLYAARECGRIFVLEGHDNVFRRHTLAGKAMLAATQAMGLTPYGDIAHKMPNICALHIPPGVNGDRLRRAMLDVFNIEIGTSFGPLAGKVWRIGTMGYNARPDCVYQTVLALEALLAAEGHSLTRGAAIAAAQAVYAT